MDRTNSKRLERAARYGFCYAWSVSLSFPRFLVSSLASSLVPALATVSGCALLLAAAPAANAQADSTYNFLVQGGGQYGSNALYNGTGALTGSGNTWNVLTLANQTINNAQSSDGQASTTNFYAQFANEDRNPYTNFNDGIAGNPSQLLSNYIRTGDPNLVLQLHFSGLAANSAFSLYLYGANGADGFQGGRGTVFKQTLSDYSSAIQTASTFNLTQAAFVEGDNYVVFNGTTDSTGDIYATYQANTSQSDNVEAQFNGAQLRITPTAAPEPGSLSLLGMGLAGGAGMVGMVRRRKAKGKAELL